MHVSLLHFQPAPGDRQGNLAGIARTARTAAVAGSTLLVTS